MKEDEIVKALKENNEESFIEVVELYKNKIVSLCYSYTQDYGEAEDISQEVFISIYKGIKNFREEASLSTYIYKITVSRCLDYKRRKNIKGFLTGLFQINKEIENTFDKDDKNAVREAVSNLPEDLRICIVLYYFIGLTQKEVSNILDISPKNVEGRIYRAKKRLKAYLKEGGFGFE
ncbi:RNA polymerase sigma factor [Clostridium sp. BSD9I1]|uniref:RNA polymerase sigma factor n=1 Tax=Clostridium sp. BSD9I1 TaxID=2003589 RepID=UPI001647DFDD|nr:RNA polymerase sigma factor [Clostridium sp. BSD9I1]